MKGLPEFKQAINRKHHNATLKLTSSRVLCDESLDI